MQVRVNPDIEKLVAFMESNFAADRLVGIARGLSQIAPVIWGHHDSRPLMVLRLDRGSLVTHDPQLTATESCPGQADVGGDFGAEAYAHK